MSDCCHPSAPWHCALCGAGVSETVTIMGGVQTCRSCYGMWADRVGAAMVEALDHVARVGLRAMLARATAGSVP